MLIRRSIALLVAPAIFAGACASTTKPSPGAPANQPVVGERPVAVVDNVAVLWSDLHPALAEAAGGQALQEWVLDHRLDEEASRRQIKIVQTDIDRERDLLLENLAHAGLTPDESSEMLQRLRRQRGLGDVRFAALLRRNALLRAIVGKEIEITPDMLQRAYDVANGPRVRCRLIVTLHAAEAAEARAAVATNGQPDRGKFIDTAVKVSTDESGARGGLIEAFSPADLAYPAALRQSVATMKPGELSTVIALDRGYAIVYIEAIVPPTGKSLESTKADLERGLRVRQERLQMDQLARQMLSRSGVAIFDRATGWSWDAADALRPAPANEAK